MATTVMEHSRFFCYMAKQIEFHKGITNIRTVEKVMPQQISSNGSYIEEHPRMSYEKPVSATLMVEEYFVEAVETEFRITSKIKTQEHLFRIRIISTKTAICNWLINLTEHIKIETTSDPTIIDQLCQKAQCIIENYQKTSKIT